MINTKHIVFIDSEPNNGVLVECIICNPKNKQTKYMCNIIFCTCLLFIRQSNIKYYL